VQAGLPARTAGTVAGNAGSRRSEWRPRHRTREVSWTTRLRTRWLLVPFGAALAAATAALLAAAFPKATARVTLPPDAMPEKLGSTLKGDEVMHELRQRLAERSLPGDVSRRLLVVQRSGERHAELVAETGSAVEARRLVTAWRDSVYALDDWETRNLAEDADLGDEDDWTPYNGGGGPEPELSRTRSPDVVTHGDDAVLVSFRNTENVPRSKYVWSEDAIPVNPGSTYRITAVVSGEATTESPVRLGIRFGEGAVTQVGLSPLEHGLTMRETATGRRLHGLFPVPRGITAVQIAIWREQLRPGTFARIAIDDVRVVRSRALHVSSFDVDASGWSGYHGNGGPTPKLSITSDPRFVGTGARALFVSAHNPERVERSKYVWAIAPIRVRPGEAYEVAAVVSGAATEDRPLRLGLRHDSGAVRQEGLAPIGSGITKTDGGLRRRLHGRFVVPRGVETIQPAVWRTLAPGARASFTLDDVRVVRTRTLLAEGFEDDASAWIAYSGEGVPALSLSSDEDIVRSGSQALVVSGASAGGAFVWTAAPIPISQDATYDLSALVGGAASEDDPVRLGVRVPSGAVTQSNLLPAGGAVTKADDRPARLLRGRYVAPEDVSAIQPAIWREAGVSRRPAPFVVDDVRLVQSGPVLDLGEVVVAIRSARSAASFALPAGAVLGALVAVLLGRRRALREDSVAQAEPRPQAANSS
jgi:hypothetical protein